MHTTTRYRPVQSTLCALALGAILLAASAATAAPRAQPHHGQGFKVTTSSGGQLGAKVTSISDDLRRYFGAPKGVGLLVDKVMPDTPAARAGLKSGDLITGLEGQPVAHRIDIFRVLARRSKGDKVKLEVLRNKKRKTLQVLLDGHSALHMEWHSAGAVPSPFGANDPLGKDHGFDSDYPFPPESFFGPDDPFGRGHSLGQGDGHAECEQGAPSSDSAAGSNGDSDSKSMQSKMRALEKRLEHLESKSKSKSKGKSKVPAPSSRAE